MEDKIKNHREFSESSDPRLLEKEMNINMPTYPYKTSSEYAVAVNQWLWQCYNLQCMALTFPYIMTHTACRPQAANTNSTVDFNRNFTSTFYPNQNVLNQSHQTDNSARVSSAAANASQGIFKISLYLYLGKYIVSIKTNFRLFCF